MLLIEFFLDEGSHKTQVLHAQELNCTVQINSDQIQGTNKSVFNTLNVYSFSRIILYIDQRVLSSFLSNEVRKK